MLVVHDSKHSNLYFSSSLTFVQVTVSFKCKRDVFIWMVKGDL